MKKLKKLKLNNLSTEELTGDQMKSIKGGKYCYGSCYYASSGGSSDSANCRANYSLSGWGGQSTKGSNYYEC